MSRCGAAVSKGGAAFPSQDGGPAERALGLRLFAAVQAISSLTSRRNPPMFQTSPAIVAKTAQANKAPAGFDLSTKGE
jgi:hypothetical protein